MASSGQKKTQVTFSALIALLCSLFIGLCIISKYAVNPNPLIDKELWLGLPLFSSIFENPEMKTLSLNSSILPLDDINDASTITEFVDKSVVIKDEKTEKSQLSQSPSATPVFETRVIRAETDEKRGHVDTEEGTLASNISSVVFSKVEGSPTMAERPVEIRMMRGMASALLIILALLATGADASLNSRALCKACSKCTEKQCPISDSYPHMTAYDDSLIAGAFQSDYVSPDDPRVYSVPDVKGGEGKLNAYYGWKSVSGSADGYHRFENYMDKCNNNRVLMASKDSKVGINKVTKENVASAEWKRINAPKKENHREFQFLESRNTGLCLTVGKGKGPKKAMVMEKCNFDGSNTRQLFAFRFHYRSAFCCCNLHNKIKN